MKIAVVHVGTHALEMVVATLSDDGVISVLGDFAQEVGIGPYIGADLSIGQTALSRLVQALRAFRQILDNFGEIRLVKVSGTPLLGRMKNGSALLETIQKLFGVPLVALPPDEAAAYAFLASWDAVAVPDGALTVLADVAGGGIQVIVGQGRQIVHVATVEIETHALVQQFLHGDDPASETLALCQHVSGTLDLASTLERIGGRPFELIGSGSPVTTCAAMALEIQGPSRSMVHGLALPYETMDAQFERLVQATEDDVSGIVGLGQASPPGLIVALAIWLLVLERLSAKEVVVSANGLRHGMLREICGLDRLIQ